MRIILITPFVAERSALTELLRIDGHAVVSVATRSEGLREASATRPDVIIADAQVPGIDGLALVRELAERGQPPRLILLCPRATRVLEKLGALCLPKPIDLARLQWELSAWSGIAARVA